MTGALLADAKAGKKIPWLLIRVITTIVCSPLVYRTGEAEKGRLGSVQFRGALGSWYWELILGAGSCGVKVYCSDELRSRFYYVYHVYFECMADLAV